MEAEKETPPPIIDQLKEYAETRLKLAKLEVIDKSTSVFASMVMDVIVAISFILTFLFLSFALAFYLSSVLGHSYAAGFSCVALLYLIIAVTIIFNKEKLQKPLVNLLIKKLF